MVLEQVIRGRQLVGGAGRRLRLEAGLLVKEVADALGVDEGSVIAWEMGHRRPSTEHAARWAELMDQVREVLDREPVA
jgi:transcriptional regulator with XRE-family HTH domain